jgi:voltage-gated potassium channel
MYMDVKRRIYSVLEHSDERSLVGRAINLFIVALIILNVAAIMLDTVQGVATQYAGVLWNFEIFSVAIFSVEYIARVWACNTDKKYAGIIKGRLQYMASPMAIVDLLAILPFYIPFIIPFDLRVLRVLRLIRLIRIFKLARYNESLSMMKKILLEKKEDLSITLFMGLIVLVLASTAMYYAEHDAQPDKFSSIPETLYWGVITLATIGYGDMYPVTVLGKFFGAIIAVTGIGMFAIPTGIIGSGFIEELQKKREKKNICPHCGKSIDELPDRLRKEEEIEEIIFAR